MTLNEIFSLVISLLALALSVMTYVKSQRQDRDNVKLRNEQERIAIEQSRQETLILVTRIEGLDQNLKRKFREYALNKSKQLIRMCLVTRQF